MSTVVQTTIQTMIQYPAPSPLPPDRRVAPQEFTLYGINATMVGFKLETVRSARRRLVRRPALWRVCAPRAYSQCCALHRTRTSTW
jgi:hypothetical protein